MTQKEAFLYYFGKMDIIKLNEVLTDDIFYCGIPKNLFLNKLSDVFNRNLQKGIKECLLKIDVENSNTLLYPDGNKIGKLFIADNNGKITGFINKNSLFDGCDLFQIYSDEQEGYRLTDEDKILINLSNEALTDLKLNQPITKFYLTNFIEKYKQYVDADCKRYDFYTLEKVCVFESIFVDLKDLIDVIWKYDIVYKTLLDFRKCNTDIQWYLRNKVDVESILEYSVLNVVLICDKEQITELYGIKFKIPELYDYFKLVEIFKKVEKEIYLNSIN